MSDQPLVQDSASVKQVRQARKREKQSQREEMKDLRWVLSTRQGRRFLRRVVTHCRVFTQPDIESTNRVLVNEGKRSIGLWLIAETEVAEPSALPAILFNQDSNGS